MTNGSRDDLLWLAGLLEGEGSFDAHKGRYARVRLGMTDRDIVTRAATVMGSRVRLALHALPDKASWHTEITGTTAVEIMREILPYMGARRSQKIAEVLGVVAYRDQTVKANGRLVASVPGPQLTLPAGVLAPEEVAA